MSRIAVRRSPDLLVKCRRKRPTRCAVCLPLLPVSNADPVYFAAVGLSALAITLAWPAPIVLAKASWPARAPGTALLLWQAIALSGGLSMIGALLCFGLVPFGDDLGRGWGILTAALLEGPLPANVGTAHIVALALALILGIHLLLNLINTAVHSERERRRHHALVELLSSPIPDRPGTRMLEHPAPVAYCLPGVHTITVLSEGLIGLLNANELDAVIAHERAHLRQYHHLVLLAFRAWNAALPWFPIANRAERAVTLLVELLADDRARTEVDDATLASAIVLVGGYAGDTLTPSTARPAASDTVGVSARLSRLLTPTSPLSTGVTIAVFSLALLLPIIPATYLFAVLAA